MHRAHRHAGVCGQLPEKVATALEPLLATHTVTATVSTLPKHPAAPVPALLTLAPRAAKPPPPHERGPRQRALDGVVAAARAVHDSVSEGTGECLRRHYAAMLASVRAEDGHLLDDGDRRVAAAVDAAPPQAQGLLLRLRQRRGPWFRVGALSYADVDDAVEAAAALQAAGLLDVLRPTGARGSVTFQFEFCCL